MFLCQLPLSPSKSFEAALLVGAVTTEDRELFAVGRAFLSRSKLTLKIACLEMKGQPAYTIKTLGTPS